MVKVSSNDVLAVLRRFKHAGEETMPRHVEQLKSSNPSVKNTLVSFKFNKTQYFLLFDDNAEDDVDYIQKQIEIDGNGVNGTVIENPNDQVMTYGLPFKGKDVYLYAVQSAKKRLDVELSERFADISRSTIQKYIKAGYVTVNGEVRESPKADVTAADAIALSIPDQTDFSDETLPIIYIDDNVIVINKPVGVLTHSKGAMNDEFTVADFFRRYCTYNIDTNRPGIVHRLDRDTSGVMIGARNPETAQMLQKQFADRRTKKTYSAVVDGVLKNDSATIDLPIGRAPSAPSTFRVDAKGKTAQTSYDVIKSNGTYSLVELRPKTGRTHQLRVHMAYLNTPIHGDRVYGKVADRLYLHAHSLEITIPQSDRRTFTVLVPEEFSTLAD